MILELNQDLFETVQWTNGTHLSVSLLKTAATKIETVKNLDQWMFLKEAEQRVEPTLLTRSL